MCGDMEKVQVNLPDNFGGIELIREQVREELEKAGREYDATTFWIKTEGIIREGSIIDIAREYVEFDWVYH